MKSSLVVGLMLVLVVGLVSAHTVIPGDPPPPEPDISVTLYPKVNMIIEEADNGVNLILEGATPGGADWITSQWLIEYSDGITFYEIDEPYDYWMSGIFPFGDQDIPNEGCYDMNDDAFDGDFAYTNFVGLQEQIHVDYGEKIVIATLVMEGEGTVSLYLDGEEMNKEWWCERSNVIRSGGLHMENEETVTQTITLI